MFATENGYVNIMKLLIDHKADLTLKDFDEQTVAKYAASTRQNAEEVWKLLLDPATRLPAHDMPSDPENGPELMYKAIVAAIFNKGDPRGIATLIRHGAYKQDEQYHTKRGLMHHLIQNAWHGINDTGETPEVKQARIIETVEHVLEAGILPFACDRSQLYAYELAIADPVFAPVFRERYKKLAERVSQFDPAQDKLVDEDGKPTELMAYCCCEGKVGDVLAPRLWENSVALIKTKQALQVALPDPYQKRYAADLDSTALVRASVAGSALDHFKRPAKPLGKGRGDG